MLQVSDNAVGSKAIKARLKDRLQWWRDGGAYHAELVDDTVLEMRNRRGGKGGSAGVEREAKAFDSRVKHGKIRSAVRTATSRAGGGILMPDGVCTKTGRPVMEVLAEKAPPTDGPGTLRGWQGRL